MRFVVGGRNREYDFSGVTALDLVVLYRPGREPKAIAPAEIHFAEQYFGLED